MLRHLRRIDAVLAELADKPPRPKTRAMLEVALYELLEARREGSPGRRAKVVDHAVGQARRELSRGEGNFANALLRRAEAVFAGQEARLRARPRDPDALGLIHSHPGWLVRRWQACFGASATGALLEWNQRPPEIFLRRNARAGAAHLPEALEPTRWPGFFRYRGGDWAPLEPLLASGAFQVQDPATRLATELLAPRPGEAVLDACAAPGGKAVALGGALAGSGSLTALDLPGERLKPLREALTRLPEGLEYRVVEADLFETTAATFREADAPERFDAILLDVPCSNTGVLRRRPDARWRLRKEDFTQLPEHQLALLERAGVWLKPGGRLVYSTCSLEFAENRGVVAAFQARHPAFRLAHARVALPWLDGHDGAGAYRLEHTT